MHGFCHTNKFKSTNPTFPLIPIQFPIEFVQYVLDSICLCFFYLFSIPCFFLLCHILFIPQIQRVSITIIPSQNIFNRFCVRFLLFDRMKPYTFWLSFPKLFFWLQAWQWIREGKGNKFIDRIQVMHTKREYV